MKNKILASVLAVCLFVGMAVPAFAATTAFSSSVDGDPSTVTKIEFFDGNKVLPELKLEQDDIAGKDIKDYVRLFTSKDQLILNSDDVDYALDGGSLFFTLDPDTSKVTAIADKGTANVVVTSRSNAKVSAKLKLVAAPKAPAKKTASGYKFENRINTVPVGAYAPADAKGPTITVVPTPAGTVFNLDQKTRIDGFVGGKLADILSYADVDGAAGAAPTTHLLAAAGNSIIVKGLPLGKDLTVTVTSDATAAAPGKYKITKTTSDATGLTMDIAYNSTGTAVEPISVNALASAIRKEQDYKSVTLEYYVGTTLTEKFASTVASGDAVLVNGFTTNGEYILATIASERKDDKIIFEVTNADDLLVTDRPVAFKIADTDFYDGNVKQQKVNLDATFQNVKAVPVAAIGATPVIEMEVGEIIDLTKHVQYPTTANVGKGFTAETVSANDVDPHDFAAVNGTDIIGVKKGTNKVLFTSTFNSNLTYLATVKVISRGTKVVPTIKTKAPKVEVGKTTVFAITGAKGDITYKSADEKIAKIDKEGKITGVKAGTTKITATVDGVTLEDTVTVSAAVKPEAKPDGKPSTNPSTGVALLGQLF